MHRELAEEVRLAGDLEHLVTFANSAGLLTEVTHVYLATGLHEADLPDGFVADGEEAGIEVLRLPLAEALAAVLAERRRRRQDADRAAAGHPARVDSRRQRRPKEGQVRVGVPTEIKEAEYRVAITPAGVRELTYLGHEVLVQAGAGEGLGAHRRGVQGRGRRARRRRRRGLGATPTCC